MLLHDLFQAYFDARRNKRKTINALKFEENYESEIFRLYEEIENRTYRPGTSICFVTEYPVKREIFAADFRDRVVHHLLYNYISPIFERYFITDAYSCRAGKGTHYGIKRLDRFVRSCSENYQKDCYILQLDIKGYFMSMDKKILYNKAREKILKYLNSCGGGDLNWNLINFLLYRIIFHDPVKNCRVRGKRENWVGLPKDKSLFFCRPGTGLPIGNLTSQLFGNVYLMDFDSYVKHRLGLQRYSRYVDDFAIVSRQKQFLKCLPALLDIYLKENLKLKLHPRKIKVKHFTDGVDFLGGYIKPGRIYVRNRTKGNFYKTIEKFNRLARDKKGQLNREEVDHFEKSVNSYLGTLGNFNTRKLRKKMMKEVSGYWENYFYYHHRKNKLCRKRR